MTEISVSGPLFDGRAQAALFQGIDAIEDRVAQEGYDRVQQRLGQVLKHPTGYYESRIVVDRSSTDRTIVGDNVIYGPWLEGVGSRNYPKTRFKGYATFRYVTQQLDADAETLADEAIAPYVEEMN
jgi:hypothetical protein